MAVVAVDAAEPCLEDLSAGEDLLQALEPGQACCHDCGQVFKVTELHGRWRKKVCTGCRRTEHTLWRHVGGWEPLQTLSDEERHNFFSKTSGSSCWKTVQSRLVESLTRERVTSLGVSVGGKYLPPAVWLKKGFTQDQVDRCQDWEDNEVLGRTCRLQVKEVSQTCVVRTVQTELLDRVKEVSKGKAGKGTKTWELQTPAAASGKEKEDPADKKAARALAKNNKTVLSLATKVLGPVTNAWLQAEQHVGKPVPPEQEPTVALLKESHALLQSWKTSCEQVLKDKENTGDQDLSLPFSKEEVDTRVKSVTAAVKELKEARRAEQQEKKAAKQEKTSAKRGDGGSDQQAARAAKRLRTKSSAH